MIRRLFVGSVARSVLIVTQIAIGFFMMPFLVENLGSRWYGIWTVLSGIVAYFYLMDVGLGSAVQLYVARHIATQDYDGANRVVNTAFFIYGVISIAILLVTVVLSLSIGQFLDGGADHNVVAIVLLLLGINIAAEFPMNAFSGIINAYARYDLLSYVRFIMSLINAGLTVYFVGHGYGVVALSIIALSCGLVSNVNFFLLARYCFRDLRVGWRWFDWSQVKELGHYSAWSMLNSISYLVKYKMQPLIVAFFLGPVAVTHYVIGSRLSDYFRDLLFQATNLSMPILTKYHVLGKNDELRTKLQLLTKINTMLAVFGGGLIILVGKAFISRWMGAEFATAYPILVVLIVAMAVEIMLDPAKVAITSMGNIRFIGIVEMIETIFNVLLCVVLVKIYGLVGAALGMAIPLLIMKLFVVPYVLCRRIDMPVSTLYKSLLPAACVIGGYMALYAWGVHSLFDLQSYQHIAIVCVLSAPLFAVLALLVFNASERAILKRLLPGAGAK